MREIFSPILAVENYDLQTSFEIKYVNNIENLFTFAILIDFILDHLEILFHKKIFNYNLLACFT